MARIRTKIDNLLVRLSNLANSSSAFGCGGVVVEDIGVLLSNYVQIVLASAAIPK
jgi:hypothetical protein